MTETLTARSALSPQRSGFLASSPYPFTHSLSPYLGCGFGGGVCGAYCYAPHLPNWRIGAAGRIWGSFVRPKSNIANVLATELASKKSVKRKGMRVFLSPATDPYQPLESTAGLTRSCLQELAQWPDLELVVVQTRAPLAGRGLELMSAIPYLWLSVTIETDDEALLRRGGGPSVKARLRLAQEARAAGVPLQITVSPCMPYSGGFADLLISTGAQRLERGWLLWNPSSISTCSHKGGG